jgi:hypothetical protein
MARRQVIAKKTRKVRTTKSETYLINSKHLGDEPIFNGPVKDLDYTKALTWYNYMASDEEARQYLGDYLRKNNRALEAKRLAKVSDVWYPKIAAWIARMTSRGAKLSDSSYAFFEKSIKEALKRVKDFSEEEAPVKKGVDIQQKIRERSDDILCEIEGMIDDGLEFDLYEWLKKKEVPSVYVSFIIPKYQPWLADLVGAYEGDDEQLVEGYSHLTKKQLEERILFFNKILEDAERYGSNEKKVRAVRKPKAISVDKKLKNFVFKKEDKELKLASVNPEKIIGSQELWAFNTKYKTLTVFRAIDRGGLQINRSSIVNYNEETSATKKIGRKTEYYLDRVLNGGKIVLRKLMDEIKGEAPFAKRVNENTILLKVV